MIGLLIWLEDRGPIFYSQYRVGKDGKIFKAIKFRSMIKDAEKQTGAVWAKEDDPRITKIGEVGVRYCGQSQVPKLSPINFFFKLSN